VTVYSFAPGLYRGSRPETLQNVRHLKALGVKTILNLQSTYSNEELRWATSNGLARLSLNLCPVLPPSKENVEIALQILTTKELFPIFLHCRMGKDRTGFIVASYRIRVEGVPVEDAKEEMKRMGNHWHLSWWRSKLG